MKFKKGNTSFKSERISNVSIILMIGAIIFLFLSLNAKKNSKLLKSDGIIIESVIIEKSISSSEDYGDKYYIKYRYNYKNEEYSNENRVDEKLWEDVKKNDNIPIRVQLDKPSNSEINSPLIFSDGEEYSLISFALFFTCLMFIIIPNYKPFIKYLEERQKLKN